MNRWRSRRRRRCSKRSATAGYRLARDQRRPRRFARGPAGGKDPRHQDAGLRRGGAQPLAESRALQPPRPGQVRDLRPNGLRLGEMEVRRARPCRTLRRRAVLALRRHLARPGAGGLDRRRPVWRCGCKFSSTSTCGATSPAADGTRAAVVLVSGGLDSATTLALARQAGFRCYRAVVRLRAAHAVELQAAAAWPERGRRRGAPRHPHRPHGVRRLRAHRSVHRRAGGARRGHPGDVCAGPQHGVSVPGAGVWRKCWSRATSSSA